MESRRRRRSDEQAGEPGAGEQQQQRQQSPSPHSAHFAHQLAPPPSNHVRASQSPSPSLSRSGSGSASRAAAAAARASPPAPVPVPMPVAAPASSAAAAAAAADVRVLHFVRGGSGAEGGSAMMPSSVGASTARSAVAPSPHAAAGAGASASAHALPAAASAEARPSKRARRSPSVIKDDDSTASSAAAAAAAGAGASAAPSPSQSQLQSQHKDDLACIVCLELPPCDIMQCSTCHRKIVNGPRSVCPCCRVHLSRANPIRNRLAEKVKAALRVPCTLDGCHMCVTFSELDRHEKEECGFRQTICVFQPLGCDWRGIANKNPIHESECPIRRFSPKKLLSLVKARNEQRDAAYKEKRENAAQHSQLVRMLSKRCRDLTIRDIVIERDPLTDEMCTRTFVACSLKWEVFLDQPVDQTHSEVLICLRIVEPIHRKITIECFCLPGPDLDMDFPPTLRRVSFRKNVTQSESFKLPFSREQARNVHAMDSVSLRMGFLDISPGAVSSSFTTHNASFAERAAQEQDDEDSAEEREDAEAEEEEEDEQQEGGGGGAAAEARQFDIEVDVREMDDDASQARGGSSSVSLPNSENVDDEDEEAVEDERGVLHIGAAPGRPAHSAADVRQFHRSASSHYSSLLVPPAFYPGEMSDPDGEVEGEVHGAGASHDDDGSDEQDVYDDSMARSSASPLSAYDAQPPVMGMLVPVQASDAQQMMQQASRMQAHVPHMHMHYYQPHMQPQAYRRAQPQGQGQGQGRAR